MSTTITVHRANIRIAIDSKARITMVVEATYHMCAGTYVKVTSTLPTNTTSGVFSNSNFRLSAASAAAWMEYARIQYDTDEFRKYTARCANIRQIIKSTKMKMITLVKSRS